ncbi:replication-relaxation family protein [Lactococcus allomyrinae]|uniref:Uncharacterized protein n=1 Tax=Lactococcus allomyrinae TaxID=2419773 RepID=A0A387BFH6_9LACT|nr:hypothetical protein [Lactococcus allomyrinae]AYF99865.1 hypothetical protein D7I46_01455 [Lactococcus allomyrinae]
MVFEQELHLDFIKLLYPFTWLSYAQINQLWKNASGSKTKMPSGLLKKLESEGIIKRKIAEGRKRGAQYHIRQEKIKQFFSGTTRDVLNNILPAFFRDAFPVKSPSHTINFHNEALKNVLVSFYSPYFDSLVLPRIKTDTKDIIIPDAILCKGDFFSYLEYDNLTEERAALLSKIPRYLYVAKQQPNKKHKLIIVFTDETTIVKGFQRKRKSPPFHRMENFVSAVKKIKALNGLPLVGEISKQENFELYLFTYREAIQYLESLFKGKSFPDYFHREFTMAFGDNFKNLQKQSESLNSQNIESLNQKKSQASKYFFE